MKMKYTDVYFRRVGYHGSTMSEIAKNQGEVSFEKWLKESPHTVRDLSVERGLHFAGIILQNKADPNKITMLLNVSNSIPLKVGDIVNWHNDGLLEKWIIYQKEKKVNGGHQVFFIVKCNYLLKWVNNDGLIEQTWSYIVSSMNSKVKENFRTWNALITPQPNKYTEILIPYHKINRHTRFIIEDEGWYMVEDDHTSVAGVSYLSLTEEKINLITDNLVDKIADTDKIAIFKIVTTDSLISSKVGQPLNINFTTLKNGENYSFETKIVSLNTDIIKEVNGSLIGVKTGTARIKILKADDPNIFIEKEVTITSAQTNTIIGYLSGPDTIRLDRIAEFKLEINQDIQYPVYFSINNESLAKMVEPSSSTGIGKVHANANNKLGTFTLTADYLSQIFTKEIKVIPLW